MSFHRKGVFVDNPVARLDMRVQMRGNRPMVVWTVYLGLLTLIATFSYLGVANAAGTSASAAQGGLQAFNWAIMVTLSSLVLLTAPALTAAAMAAERQRRALELFFSTPASPTLYVWGKLTSAYRTVWVLLLLAIPIAAVGYVMGGGTWLDVLAAFMIVSYNGLLLCAVAMVAASISSSPLGAVVLAYILGGIVQVGLTILSFVGMTGAFMGVGMNNVNPLGALNAFLAVGYSSAKTEIFGRPIPTFIPAGIIVFLASLVIVMGASSGMTRFKSPETRVFRGVLIALAAGAGAFLCIEGPGVGSYTALLGTLTAGFGLFIPYFACFEKYGDQKFRDDGLFNVRRLFVGAPASALPLALSLCGLVLLPLAIRGSIADLTGSATRSVAFSRFSASAATSVTNSYTSHLLPTVYFFVFISFLWIACRLVSRLGNNLSSARVLGTAVFLGVSILPAVVAGWLQAINGGTGDFYRFIPLSCLGSDPGADPTSYLIHIVLGTVVVVAGVTLDIVLRKREHSVPPVL